MTDTIWTRPISGAALCLTMAVGGGEHVCVTSTNVPVPFVVVETPAAADAIAATFEYRGSIPLSLGAAQLQQVALRLPRELEASLGPGVRIVFEELVNPDDDEQTATLYAIVLLQIEQDEALDEFILREWSKQPVNVRRSIRIGREFV